MTSQALAASWSNACALTTMFFMRNGQLRGPRRVFHRHRLPSALHRRLLADPAREAWRQSHFSPGFCPLGSEHDCEVLPEST